MATVSNSAFAKRGSDIKRNENSPIGMIAQSARKRRFGFLDRKTNSTDIAAETIAANQNIELSNPACDAHHEYPAKMPTTANKSLSEIRIPHCAFKDRYCPNSTFTT